MKVEHRKFKGNAAGKHTEMLVPCNSQYKQTGVKTTAEKLVHSMYLSNTCTSAVPCSVFLRKRNKRISYSPAEPANVAGNFDIYIIKDISIPANTSLEILSDFKYDYNFHLMFTITGSESLTLDMIFKYE